jgi:predicted MFS family arabinose efflux permease
VIFFIAQLAMGSIMWTSAVTAVFKKNRGLALALMLTGSAAAAAVLPPLVLHLYKIFGIRGVFTAIACIFLVVNLPMQIFYSLPSKGKRFDLGAGEADPAAVSEFSLFRAMSGLRFWQLAIGFTMAGGLVGSVIVHFQALMTDKGMSMERAAWIMSLFGPASLAGRLVTGMLLDRCTARQIIVPVFSFPIIACFILANFHGEVGLAVVVAIFAGVAFGAEADMMAYFVSRYFGTTNYPSIYAALVGLFSVGFGVIPVLAGFLFDRIGSYDIAFAVLGVLLLISVMIMMRLGRYPDLRGATAE